MVTDSVEDLEAIWRYTVEQSGIDQAKRYLNIIFACFGDLSTNPELGRRCDDVKPGYRSFPQGRHVVFHTIVPTGIEIIGVVHQSSDVGKHLQ